MQAWQAQIEAYAGLYWVKEGPVEPITGFLRLRLEFHLPFPKSAPKTLRGRQRYCQKNPGRYDVTNMQKAFEDALQGIVMVNDRQVIHIESTKQFTDSAEGWTQVWVEEL